MDFDGVIVCELQGAWYKQNIFGEKCLSERLWKKSEFSQSYKHAIWKGMMLLLSCVCVCVYLFIYSCLRSCHLQLTIANYTTYGYLYRIVLNNGQPCSWISISYALHIIAHYCQFSKRRFQFHLTCSIAFEADSLMTLAPGLFKLLNLRNECINHLRMTNTPAQNSTYLLYKP